MFDTKRIIAATTALAMSLCTACGADEGGSTLSNNPVVLTDMGGTSTSNNTTPEDMPDGMTPDGGMTSGDDMDMDQTDPPDQDMETPPTACMRDGDCTAPQVCTVDTSTGSAQCTDPLGPNDTGSACLDGAECQSGLCVNGACAEPCTGDADCPNGFECTTQSVPLDGGGVADLNVCTEAPTPCLADPDCTDPEVCVIDRSGADPELLCQDPVPGASDLGESCNADNECRSGLCLEQVCSRPCERPIDCSQDGSFICEPTEVTTGTGMTSTVNVCRPKPATQCLSDSDCAGSERCIASKSSTAVEFVCDDPNAGGSEEGASCAQDSDCAQNLCLDGTCAAPCQQNGDCTAPDFSCELTDVPVGNNLTDSAQVCVPPVTCTERDECKLNEVCYVRRAQQDIESVCRGGNAGGGSLGQVCSRDSECAANLCYDGRFGQVCSAPCKDDTDCGAAGYTCRTVDVATAGGGTASASICAPDDPPACASNNDCQTGTTCAIVPNTAGNALTSVCIPSKGKLATGVACAMDSECDSEVCLDGSCAAPCTDTNQCGVSQVCQSNSINKNNLAGSFQVCERLMEQMCSSTRDCTDGIRACGALRQDAAGDVAAFCAFPNSGGAQLGSSCTNNVDCRDGLCLGVNNECSVACALDSDCSTAANQVCSSLSFSATNNVEVCMRSCVDNSSCNGGDVCTINSDIPNDDIDQVCAEPSGAGQLGALCATGNDCITGLCLTTTTFDGRPCTTDAQCTGGAGNAGKTCECPVDQPNCTTGKQCASAQNRCSRICNDNADCIGGITGNPLNACSTDVNVTRPSGNGVKLISMCGEN